MITAYLACAVFGVAFMGISALAGHFGGHGGQGQGGHGGHGGHGHAGHAGHLAADSIDLPFFSPSAISAYLTGFGSAGLIITQGLHVTNPWIHVPASAAFAVGFGVSALFGMAKLTQRAEGNSLASTQDVMGQLVEVTIAIPAGGEGEVAYVDAGTRQTAIARADAGQSFAQGASVRVTRVAEGTIYVTTAGALASVGVSVGEPVETPPAAKERVK